MKKTRNEKRVFFNIFEGHERVNSKVKGKVLSLYTVMQNHKIYFEAIDTCPKITEGEGMNDESFESSHHLSFPC